jgi:hypothetical protein
MKNVMGRAYGMHGGRRGAYRVLVGNLRERDHSEEPVIDWRIISRLILRKWDVKEWTESFWLGIGTSAGICECGNEPSGSVTCM